MYMCPAGPGDTFVFIDLKIRSLPFQVWSYVEKEDLLTAMSLVLNVHESAMHVWADSVKEAAGGTGSDSSGVAFQVRVRIKSGSIGKTGVAEKKTGTARVDHFTAVRPFHDIVVRRVKSPSFAGELVSTLVSSHPQSISLDWRWLAAEVCFAS